MKKIVIATANPGKLEEINQLLAGWPVEVVSLKEVPGVPKIVEDRDTFVGNAVKKAEVVSSHTGEITIADDSGLEVDALDGAPGVCSARFAGEHATDEENNRKLLDKLKEVEEGHRTARFRCVIAIAVPGRKTVTVEGACEGMIAFEPEGTNGFGYDPLFYYPPKNCTLAQLDSVGKNRVSHRGKALEKARQVLRELLY